MNKKKLLTLVLTLALIGAVGVGATLAYFTDQDTAKNTVTMGHVEIELTETDAEGNPVDGLVFSDIVPGQDIAKDPTVKVISGSENGAYIRVKVEVTEGYEDVLDNLYLGDVEFDTVWTLGDGGYYYLAAPVKVNAEVKVFDKVVIPAGWDNDFAGETFEINITAEAIQADYFTPTTNEDGVPAWVNANGEIIAEADDYVVAQ